MALPFLMLGAALAAREGFEGYERGSAADIFRRNLGNLPGQYGGQESLMEGDPAQITPGTGLRGALAQSPELLAMLELAGGMAGQRGVGSRQLLSIADRLTGLQHGGRLQNEQLAWDRDKFFRGIDENATERQFRAGQQESRFDFEDDQRYLRNEDSRAMEELRRRNERALAAYRASLKGPEDGPKLPTGFQYYELPGGYRVPGPMPSTEQFNKQAMEAQDAASAVDRVDRLVGSYFSEQGQGRKYTGPAAGEQAALYAQIKADIASAQKKGVLQEFEDKRLEDVYPNPQEFFGKFGAGDAFTHSVMKELRRQSAEKYEQRRKASPFLYALPQIAPDLKDYPTQEGVARREADAAGRVPGAAAKDFRAIPGTRRAESAEREARRQGAR